MMRSLFSAISGLKNHQTFMDVVGNNIANVNTTAFKESNVSFEDVLSQTVKDAGAAQAGRAGTNPVQIGLGMQLAGINVVQTQGTLQSTGKSTDMAIQGDGFFIMSDGVTQAYSRDGGFDLATDGTIVNPTSGLKVMGWQADTAGNVNSAAPLTPITIPIGAGMQGQPSTVAATTGNLNSNITQNDWASSNGAGGALTISGTPPAPSTSQLLWTIQITGITNGKITGMNLTSVDPTGAAGPTATATSNSVTVNGQTFTVADNAANQVGDKYYTNAQVSTDTLYDSLGSPYSVRTVFQHTPTVAAPTTWAYASTVEPAANGPLAVGSGSLTFDTAGKVATGGTEAMSITSTSTPPGITNGAADLSLSMDLTKITQLAGAGDLTATTDGAAAGTLSTFSVGQGGEFTGVYTNGL